MTELAIRAEGLGKRYRLGSSAERHDSLRDVFAAALRAPFRNFRNVRRLGTFEGDDPDTMWALRDVDFEIRHGEVVGIIGRNGAGKSTLLKVLSRITEPSVGRAVVRGRVGSLLEVGTGFHPDLTGRENVYLNGAILGMDRAHVDRRFDEIVDFAGVERFIDTPVKRYSSGMYLRLAFAVAAHLEPEILIVDEVLAVGDAQFQKKCLGKMSTVSREGRTVLFVSHNLTAVRTLCTRALLLRGGRLVADTTAADAVSRYVGEISESILSAEFADPRTAPQNAACIVQRVAVRDADGRDLQEVETGSPFRIDVEYETKHDDAFVGMTLILQDSENNIVFSSLSNREPSWYGRPMPQGTFRTSCEIPANLLNEGWYVVTLNLFGAGFSDQHLVREVLRLEIQDSGELRGDYFGPMYGIVRPDLAWRTETVKPAEAPGGSGGRLMVGESGGARVG
jgi:lipopolysaccharide transport system ATP-binding protein